jgi:hypothetical protein
MSQQQRAARLVQPDLFLDLRASKPVPWPARTTAASSDRR